MFGYGLNLPTVTTVLFGVGFAFSLKNNITSWRAFKLEFGSAAESKWAELKAKYKAWKASK